MVCKKRHIQSIYVAKLTTAWTAHTSSSPAFLLNGAATTAVMYMVDVTRTVTARSRDLAIMMGSGVDMGWRESMDRPAIQTGDYLS